MVFPLQEESSRTIGLQFFRLMSCLVGMAYPCQGTAHE